MINLSIYEALFPKGIKSNGCHMKCLYIVIIYNCPIVSVCVCVYVEVVMQIRSCLLNILTTNSMHTNNRMTKMYKEWILFPKRH